MTAPRVLLVASSPYLCLYVMQCLRGSGVELYVAGPGAAFPPRFSRFCRGFLNVDAGELARGDESAYAHIAAYCRANRIDVVFPCGMEATMFVAAAAGRLAPARPIPLASPATLTQLRDKTSFGELLRELGLPHPATAHIRSLGDLAHVPFSYPVVLKPISMHSGLGMRVVHSPEEAERYLATAPPFARPPLLAQELLRGHDAVLSLFAKDGHVLAWTTQRTERGGHRRFSPDEEILRMGAKIVARTGFSGLCCFDLFFDEPSGTVRFLECNPRIWGSVLGSTFAGVNFPLLAVRAALGQPASVAKCGTAEFWRAGQLVRATFHERSFTCLSGRLRQSNALEMVADPVPYALLAAREVFFAAARRVGFKNAWLLQN